MTLPMATRSYARVSRDLITTAICLIAAALLSLHWRGKHLRPKTTGDRISHHQANCTDCPQSQLASSDIPSDTSPVSRRSAEDMASGDRCSLMGMFNAKSCECQPVM